MGIGVADGTDHLPYARELFKTLSNDLAEVNGSNGLQTTLQDYLTAQEDYETAIIESKFGSFILQSCVNFLNSQGFDTDQHTYEITNVWLNEMTSGSDHRMHSHNGNIVSGCFYVDVPENSNNIMFEGFLSRFDKVALPVSEYTQFNSDSWTIPAQEGQLLCWNSYVKHGVPEQTFEGIRRSIAFDISTQRKR